MNKSLKNILIFITVWIAIELHRFIGMPIVQGVLNGTENAAWYYPALLGVIVALLSPIAIYLLWKKPNIYSWAFLLTYFVISIIDHGNGFAATNVAGAPKAFAAMGESKASEYITVVQAGLDLICIYLLFKNKVKKYFNISINEKV